MINLLELHVRNIFSYGNNITKIPLNFKEPTLIVGENHDVMVDGEYDNNGAGKSSILNALSYCGYGKPISPGIKVDDLINNINKKNLYTALILEKDGTYYKIERWRKNSKLGGTGNNGVKIIAAPTLDELDNPDNEKTPAGRTADEYIAEFILGMPFEVFVRIVVFSARYEAFLSLPVTHVSKTSQTSILEELFGQTELTEKATKLKEIIKNTSADIKQLDQFNQRIEAETGRYKEQLEFAEKSISTWESDHLSQTNKIKDEIATLEQIDFHEQITYLNLKNELTTKLKDFTIERDKLKDKLATYEKSNLSYGEWEIKRKNELDNTLKLLSPYNDINFDDQLQALSKIQEFRSLYEMEANLQKGFNITLATVANEIKKLDGEIDSLKKSICPYCKQNFHNNDKLTECNDKLTDLGELYSKIQDDISKSKELSQKILNDIDKIDCIYDNMVDYTASKNAYLNLKEKISTLENSKNPFTDSVVDLNILSKLVDDIESVNLNINSVSGDLSDVMKNIKNGYTPEFVYSEQSRLNQLKNNLVEKTSEINPHTETVNRLRKMFDSLDESRVKELDELKVLLEHQNFLLKLLTKKDSFIRQALLDANLPLLNTRLRYYLDIIGLPHKVEFTKEMTISISQFGNQIGYANLSGGQQARINIAIAFSFRDVVQARHEKINFCILDECLDTGLSNLGVKLASKMIKQVAKENDLSMYIITHRDEIKSSFNKKLKAILKGGLTTLEFD